MTTEAKFDSFDDGSILKAANDQEKNMVEFNKEFAEQLRNMEEALDVSLVEVWDPLSDPVVLVSYPSGRLNLFNLVSDENKTCAKVVFVFSSLVCEMRRLRIISRKRFYSPFLLFGFDMKDIDLPEGDTQVKIGKLLPVFQDLLDFLSRSKEVVLNVIRQLSCFCSIDQSNLQIGNTNAPLMTVFSELGLFLGELSFLDEICGQNKMLHQACAMYKRMIKVIQEDPARYKANEKHILNVEKLVLQLEEKLFDGQIYNMIVQQKFDSEETISIQNNKAFYRIFTEFLKQSLAHLEQSSISKFQTIFCLNYVKVCALYGIHLQIFQQGSDRKIFKYLTNFSNVCPIVPISGNVYWDSKHFLKGRVQHLKNVSLKNKLHSMSERVEFIRKLDKEFEAKVSSCRSVLSVWFIKMESSMTDNKNIHSVIRSRSQLFFEGLRIAQDISNLYRVFTLTHIYMRITVKPILVIRLCNCVEFLKAIQYTFLRKSSMLGESVGCIIRHLQFSLHHLFNNLKIRMEKKSKSVPDASLHYLFAFRILFKTLKGPLTNEGKAVMQICLNHIFASGLIKPADVVEASEISQHLSIFSDFHSLIEEACDCSFMAWNTSMVPLYFSEIFSNPIQAPCLQYMFSAFNDIQKFFSIAVHTGVNELQEVLGKSITTPFFEKILKPLRESLENDLRLEVHSHLNILTADPFKKETTDLSIFLDLGPLRLFQDYILIKHHITQYLDTTFYNLTTVSLSDWKTYTEMRTLAQKKYGLYLSEMYLPGQTLEQGLDMLEVMRNIHIVMSRYYYNLNNQVFIEKTSPSKTLNTINIQHVSNSIRTHGAGIINTTINFTYQFLRRKFVVFSQFLYDDHIKSRLLKDARFFRDQKTELSSIYPYNRADRFNKEIHRLGVTDDGHTYLDQFRILITEIGNAMGYVRLIRSGGFLYTANSIKFIPDLKQISKMKEMAEESEFSIETVTAASILDDIQASLQKQFSEESNYFKMLTNVFTKEFRNPNNVHLNTFYIIIGPLTINFVEHILGLREQMAKDAKRGKNTPGSFTDDGFAMGLAYILVLLKQYKDFDALHWFQGVFQKFVDEMDANTMKFERYQKKKGKLSDQDEGTMQSLTLNMRKNQRFHREFEMLWYCFRGARIFFNFDVQDQMPPEEAKQENTETVTSEEVPLSSY